MEERSKRAVAAILALQAVLGSCYLLRTAPFNAPDEPAHLWYVDHLARTGRLPVARPQQEHWSYEAFQPPLYYLLALPIYRIVEGRPLEYRVMALRWQSLLYALLNTLLIAFLAARVVETEAALWAAGFAALLPQQLFLSGSVANDVLANLLATTILYLAARPDLQSAPEAARFPRWSAVLGYGGVLGLALLSKATTACALGAFIAAMALRRGLSPLRRLNTILGPIALATALSGWFYLRNARLYGDLFGYGSMAGYESSMNWRELGGWLRLLFESFFGRFAWMASPLPWPAYLACGLAVAAGLAGLSLRFRRHGWPAMDSPWWPLAATLALAILQVFYHGFLKTRQPQGRFLFPALGVVALGLGAGWHELWRRLPGKWRGPAAGALAAGLAALHAVSLRAL